jgi:hypothetical protein
MNGHAYTVRRRCRNSDGLQDALLDRFGERFDDALNGIEERETTFTIPELVDVLRGLLFGFHEERAAATTLIAGFGCDCCALLGLSPACFSINTGGLRCFVACSYAKAQPSKSPSFHGRVENSSPNGNPVG